MADLSITASQVKKSTNAKTVTGTAGEEITAGETVYYDSANDVYKLADNNDTEAKATLKGIALCHAYTDQPISVQTAGTIIIGAAASVAEGTVYVQSANAGKIAPAADLASGNYTSIIGVGDGSDGIIMGVLNSGQQTA